MRTAKGTRDKEEQARIACVPQGSMNRMFVMKDQGGPDESPAREWPGFFNDNHKDVTLINNL